MVKIEFIKDFATKKKGDILEIDSMQGSYLVREKKVAKFFKKTATKK